MFEQVDIVQVDQGSIVDVDLDRDGKVCLLSRCFENSFLSVAGEVWLSWTAEDMPYARHASWISGDAVALWSASAGPEKKTGVLICSKSNTRLLPLGVPKDVFGSDEIIFASFGEDQFLLSTDDKLASHSVAAFDREGRLIFGLRDILRRGLAGGDPTEITAACALDNGRAVVAFHGCPGLWVIDPVKKTLDLIKGSNHLEGLQAVSQNGSCIYAARLEESSISFFSFLHESSENCFYDSEIFRLVFSESRRPESGIKIRGSVEGRFIIFSNKHAWSGRSLEIP